MYGYESPGTDASKAKNNILKMFGYTFNLCLSLNVTDEASHPYKTSGKIIVLYFHIFG
jgi:hypothetical protein